MGVSRGMKGQCRRLRAVAARVAVGALAATSISAGVVLVAPVGVVGADAPNPMNNTGTAVVNPDGTITVTVQGQWDWQTHRSDCNQDRFGVGWNVDWNDPAQPGFVVDTLNGVTIDVGAQAVQGGLNPMDNTVHHSKTAPYCGTYNPQLGYNTGTWGPLSHTYPAGTTTINPCAVTYDIHGKPSTGPKQGDLIAGGQGHNSDNSVEKNSAPTGNTCAQITVNLPPKLSLNKVVDNSAGGSATIANFTLTATPTNGGAAQSGTDPNPDPTVGFVVTGTAGTTYTLSESSVAGYSATGPWSCTGGGPVTNNQITLQANQNVTCVITNRATPVDLKVDKNDGGVTGVAGGAAFTYTISVQNVGSRNVDANEPVTVTDTLPKGFELQSSTGSCTAAGTPAAGQVVTCDVPPASLAAGAAPVVITLTVKVLAGTPAGTYTNNVYVTTQDDPACPAGATCPPPCPPNAPTNNVDCEDTPVNPPPTSPGLSIVKKVNGFDANTAPGLIVAAGSTLTFTYEVSNTGGTVLNNVAVTDDKGLTVSCPSTTLAVGASMICTAVGPAPASGQYTNVGTVTGTPPGGTPITSTDRANAFVAVPAIDITKFVNGADANSPPGLAVVTGSTVTWTYRVENTGNVDLVNVSVSDDKGVAVNCGGGASTIPLLKVAEQVTCSASGTAVTGLYTNVGTARGLPNPPLLAGQPPLTPTPVTDSDSASYTGAPAPVVEPPAPTFPPGTLPPTGSGDGGLVWVGIGLLALGGALLALSRRRRAAQST